jgi:tRNA nucleotidyltransferase (CCA-adding enzyme)
MGTLKGAKKIIEVLKKSGYEGYIVGGAVRDHLLRIPLTDVDITTNAKPHQVAKLFTTKPTGLKYGTVTIIMHDETYEITTYRIDGDYLDGRHPEEVTYAVTAEEDVKRRDFTINGLLMTETGEIIDHIDGQLDLRARIIRTIGDPNERFNEDALRIMRAFYFQAKLGFQIDKTTQIAIEAHRFRLKDIAMERIMNEMLKMLKGDHVRRALQTMVQTKVHEVLPGLEKGILYIQKMEEIPFIDPFFILCFILNGSIPQEWPFSNKHRHRYETAMLLVNTYKTFDPYVLYTYGLDLCLLANRVSHMLGRTKNMKNKIEEDFNNLPIQSDLDLKLRATDIIRIADKKAGAWVKKLQTEMVVEVLNKRLINEKNELEAYVLKRIKE